MTLAIKRFYPYVLLLFAITACGTKQEKTSAGGSRSIAYFQKDYALPIDQNTAVVNFINTAAVIDGEPKFFVFNMGINALQQYDVTRNEQEKVITYPKQGPGSITGITYGAGVNVVNKDTVIIFRPQFPTVYLTNLNGEVYKKLSFTPDTTVLGITATHTPLSYRKGQLYIQFGYNLMDATKEEAILLRRRPEHIAKLDLKTGKTEPIRFPYPAVYGTRKLPQMFDNIDMLYNPDIDKFVISFPLSDSIYVTDFAGNTKSYLAKSKLVERAIEVNESKNIEPSRLHDFFNWMSDSYEGLYYHPGLKLYFRPARNHLSEEDYNNRDFSKLKKEIVVLNANLEQVGIIESNSSLLYYFYDSKGIYINKDFNQFNFDAGVEDTLFFTHIHFR